MACRVIHASRLDLPLEPLPPDKVEAGAPRAGVASVPGVAGLAVGVWGSFDDIADAWTPRRTVEPNAQLDRTQWARAVERSQRWIPDLSALDF